jgi:hypothetical protein
MSKHTCGPWTHRNGRIFQTDREELTIAKVAIAFDGDYSVANGRLLAAAPELLDALENLVIDANTVAACYSRNPGNFALALQTMRLSIEQARAAIAKATGEQS